METQKPEYPNRSTKDYLNLGRTQAENHLRTERKKEDKGKPLHVLGDFLSKTIWAWAYFYLQSRFGKKYKYPKYQIPDTGVYPIGSKDALPRTITVAIASDWATDTAPAFEIVDRIASFDPEYTIHVGDTYYVGAPHEIKSNFTRENSPWVRGSLGSFSLLGNHEMYARGVSFFRDLLPTLGLRDAAGKYTGQGAGYFCLETDHWRIFGLDTGYNSTGIPILEFIPGFRPDCHFPPDLIEWLKTIVNPGNASDQRGILLLTHHQYISAFNEKEYLKPAQQLASIIGTSRPVVWLWGHEHKFAVYDKAQISNGITAYGRCIGNGGTPVELDGKAFKLKPGNHGHPFLQLADMRLKETFGDTKLGYNGFVLAKINGEILAIEYHDNEKIFLSETWKFNAEEGLQREIVYQSPDLDNPLE